MSQLERELAERTSEVQALCSRVEGGGVAAHLKQQIEKLSRQLVRGRKEAAAELKRLGEALKRAEQSKQQQVQTVQGDAQVRRANCDQYVQ